MVQKQKRSNEWKLKETSGKGEKNAEQETNNKNKCTEKMQRYTEEKV